MVESLNPNFYPRAFDCKLNQNGVNRTIYYKNNGFLTKNELVYAHGRRGDILHAKNPYKFITQTFDEWRSLFEEWLDKIKELLCLHTIQLLGDETQRWTVMRFGSRQPIQVCLMKQIR